MPDSPIFAYSFTISDNAIDENGHVNNVAYVQWMQDAAVRHDSHAASQGYVGRTRTPGRISAPSIRRRAGRSAHLGGPNGIRKVRSLRRYEFVRKSDGRLLVRGETDWIFVDLRSGRPIAIPDKVIKVLPLLDKDRTETI